jgi:hypothetical protein
VGWFFGFASPPLPAFHKRRAKVAKQSQHAKLAKGRRSKHKQQGQKKVKQPQALKEITSLVLFFANDVRKRTCSVNGKATLALASMAGPATLALHARRASIAVAKQPAIEGQRSRARKAGNG